MNYSNSTHEHVITVSQYFSYLLLVVGAFGILGNLFVCIVYKIKMRKTTTAMLFQSLAFFDILAAVALILKYCFQYVIESEKPILNHNAVIAHVCTERRIMLQINSSQNVSVGVTSITIPFNICMMLEGLSAFVQVVAIWMLCLLCLERAIGITFPHRAKELCSKKVFGIAIGSVVLINLLFFVFTALYVRLVMREDSSQLIDDEVSGRHYGQTFHKRQHVFLMIKDVVWVRSFPFSVSSYVMLK